MEKGCGRLDCVTETLGLITTLQFLVKRKEKKKVDNRLHLETLLGFSFINSCVPGIELGR